MKAEPGSVSDDEARPYIALRGEASRAGLPSSGLPDATSPDRPNVLVADSDAQTCQGITDLLREHNQVQCVPDGEVALAAVRHHPPDLILADIALPRVDGISLVRELRADVQLRGLPLILLSAQAGEEGRIRGLEAEADGYLLKPFSARELRACVAAHLQAARRRKQGEEALRESEARYRLLFDKNPDAVFAVGPRGRFLVVNPACETISGYRRDELLQMNFLELCASDQLARSVASFERTVQERAHAMLETALIRKDGRRVELWIAGEPIMFQGHVIAVHCAAKDITDRKSGEEALRHATARLAHLNVSLEAEVNQRTEELRATNQRLLRENQQRRSLEHKLLAAVEQERRRLGQELHDGLSQLLTAAKFKIGLLQRELSRGRAVPASEMEILEQDLNQAIAQAQAMARGLNPVKLVAQGLAAAVRTNFHLPCKCQCHVPAGIADPTIAQHLYRIAQEAVHNAVKHAHPRSIRLELRAARNGLVLAVHDDGVGFFAPAQPRPGHGAAEHAHARANVGGLVEDSTRPPRRNRRHLHRAPTQRALGAAAEPQPPAATMMRASATLRKARILLVDYSHARDALSGQNVKDVEGYYMFGQEPPRYDFAIELIRYRQRRSGRCGKLRPGRKSLLKPVTVYAIVNPSSSARLCFR